MKSKFVAGAVLAMLTPVVGHTAPIVWSSQSYEVDTSFGFLISGGSIVSSADVLAAPLVGVNNLTSTTGFGTITNEVSIAELANANANTYEFRANVIATPVDAVHTVGLYPGASMNNTFVASTTVLKMDYDFSGLIHFGASTPGVSYQDLIVSFGLRDLTLGSSSVPYQDLVGLHYKNNSNLAALSEDNTDYPFLFSDARQFNLVSGHSYQLKVDLFPSIFTSNTSNVNSSNSVLKINFSDGNIAAVPEPEAYALMLAGLALVGFTARRKQAA